MTTPPAEEEEAEIGGAAFPFGLAAPTLVSVLHDWFLSCSTPAPASSPLLEELGFNACLLL